MDIVKLSTDWAKAEVFSAKIVWLFSAIEIIAAIGFWYWGKTVMAKAFIWPLLGFYNKMKLLTTNLSYSG